MRTDLKRTLVVPVYRNEENIPDLLVALTDMNQELNAALEVVFVVDGSPDGSYAMLATALGRMPFESQLVALSRNFGAFSAIRTGMELARGDHVAVMAADLQEPPALVVELFAALDRDEADVAFGQRSSRNDGYLSSLQSNLFWRLYRRFVMPEIPRGGVDVFACNQSVRENVLSIREPNSSLIAQLFWVGFRRRFVPYERRARTVGKSAWHFRKRLGYMLDSVFSYTDLPILTLFWAGALGLIGSILGAAVVFGAWWLGAIAVPGYTPQMLTVLFLGSLILLTQGIIGSYVWRAFENTKQRPLTIVRSLRRFTGVLYDTALEVNCDEQNPSGR